MKKTIIIIAIILGLGAVAYGAYIYWGYFFPAKESAAPGTDGNQGASANTGTSLSVDPMLAHYESGGRVWGVQTDGQIVKIEAGRAEVLSSAKQDFISAEFSHDGKKILVMSGSRDEPSFSVFDVEESTWSPINNLKIKSASWSPTTLEVAYLERAPDKNTTIGVLTITGNKITARTLDNVSEKDSEVFWLDKNELIISSKPSGLAPSTILKYKIKEKTFEPLAMNENGVWIAWDRETKLGVRFRSGTAEVIDSSGKTIAKTNFVTLPDKCVFYKSGPASAVELYCAIPRDISANTNLPDDYFKNAVYFKDDFYKINLEDGKATKLKISSNAAFDAKDLNVAGDKIRFVNRRDNLLYEFKIELP